MAVLDIGVSLENLMQEVADEYAAYASAATGENGLERVLVELDRVKSALAKALAHLQDAQSAADKAEDKSRPALTRKRPSTAPGAHKAYNGR